MTVRYWETVLGLAWGVILIAGFCLYALVLWVLDKLRMRKRFKNLRK